MDKDRYRASAPFKSLLNRFGEVAATTSFYAATRLPGPVERPGENLTLTALEALEPDEPALVVIISADGGTRIEKTTGPDGDVNDSINVLELPEDEFWFFEAFRPTLSGLSLGAPGFLFEMALINLYAAFEAYLAGLLRQRLRRLPELISLKARRFYSSNDTASSPVHDLTEKAIGHDIRRLTYVSITLLLKQLRTEMKMTTLTTNFDHQVQVIAFIRNCLLHNGGIVDERLASADSSFSRGHRLQVTEQKVLASMTTLRNIALAIDQADQWPLE